MKTPSVLYKAKDLGHVYQISNEYSLGNNKNVKADKGNEFRTVSFRTSNAELRMSFSLAPLLPNFSFPLKNHLLSASPARKLYAIESKRTSPHQKPGAAIKKIGGGAWEQVTPVPAQSEVKKWRKYTDSRGVRPKGCWYFPDARKARPKFRFLEEKIDFRDGPWANFGPHLGPYQILGGAQAPQAPPNCRACN